MLHTGYRANRILNSTERPRATDDKILNAHVKKSKMALLYF